MNEHITALNLVLNVVQPKFSSLLRRVSKILKFFLQNKFIQKRRQGDLNYALLAVASSRSKAVPLSPFFKSPICSQLRDEVEVKTPRTLEMHAIALSCRM